MISVIVCTYNRSESLRKTLGSLAQVWAPAGTSWELIVVDNNSTDDTAEVVKTFVAASSLSVRYIFEINQGLSHARNAGIRAARGDIVAFTDDDVTVDPRWLCELRKTFDQFGCVGVGGRIVTMWICQKPAWLELDGPHRLLTPVPSFDLGEEPCELDTNTPAFGANMAFKKVAFEKYGFFRTDLGRQGSKLMSYEDTEFCTRLFRGGDRLLYAPSAIVYHPATKARLRKSYFQSLYFSHGRYMARVHGFPENAVLYFGVPRYLFRNFLTDFSKWLFIFDSRRRFRHKLELCQSLGEIFEAHRISKEGK
jgi:glycosyltransferase involved in cell wall biosynthesis